MRLPKRLLWLTVVVWLDSGGAAASQSVFLSDRAYAALSALPIDSLTDRQYDMLMRERELRGAFAAAAGARRGWSIARQPVERYAVYLSDSAYEALSAMPIGSLRPREYDLLMRERAARASLPPKKGHALLMSDDLYLRLASTPIDSLSDRDYDMLMRERQLRVGKPKEPSSTAGWVLMAALVSAGIGFFLGVKAISDAFGHLSAL